MRWFKLVFTVIILGLIALFVYQNLPVFAQNVSFKYDLRYLGNVEWKNSLCSLIAISAGFGFLVGILLMTNPLLGARRRAQQARQAPAAPTASVAHREPAAVDAASEPAKQAARYTGGHRRKAVCDNARNEGTGGVDPARILIDERLSCLIAARSA